MLGEEDVSGDVLVPIGRRQRKDVSGDAGLSLGREGVMDFGTYPVTVDRLAQL